MAELQADFELLPRETLEAEMSLEPREEIEATFELNVNTEGRDAKINGVNTLTLTATDGIELTQVEDVATLSAPGLKQDIANEKTARENADTVLDGKIDTVSGNLAQEVLDRQSADSTLQDNIDSEATARENSDDTLQDNIDAEETARKAADEDLQDAIDTKQPIINDLDTIRSNAQAGKQASDTIATYGDIVTHDVDEFATAAQGGLADTALQPGDNVSELVNDADYATKTEVSKAVSNHNSSNSAHLYIQGLISAEESRAEGVEGTLTNLTTSTKTNLVAAINEVDSHTDTNTSDISSINGKIPSEASPTNQLADKDYVDTADTTLQNQIDTLKARGRFLALWNAATGLAESNPPNGTYTYQSGDYFIVGVVSTATPPVNYKPDGSTYTTGVASTTVESEVLDVDDVYYYDGNVWRLQVNTQKTTSFVNIAGDPYDNTALATALNAKQDEISDLSTIRSNAQAGKSASDTIANYGNIVTHNTSEFATSAQGSLADSALQPGDDISELVNDAGYITGITSSDVTTALGYTPYNSSNPSGYISGITSLMVTTALGYTPVNPSSLATVATTGDYDDLLNKPTIPAAQVNSDWDAVSGVAQILNKPTLATVATSGSYNDLTNKPTIPTSSDYWTVGTSGVNDTQTTYSRKILKYVATYSTPGDDQQNGFRVLGDESASTGDFVGTGYWMGRMMVGTNKRTFLMGVTKNLSTNAYMCGLGAHSWTDAESQTGAAWEDIYIQPDGSTAVYLGGRQWRVNSGWMKVQNDGNGTAAYRTFINTGTNTSPTWRTVLPNQASGTASILLKPSVNATFSYSYATSLNGTITANYGTSVGYGSSAGNYATAVGCNAVASGKYSIQIGNGTNSTANTMNVALSNTLNVQLLDASGEIPDACIKTTIARVSQIPTDNASLTNGAGYITSSDIPVTDVEVNGTSVLNGTVAEVTVPTTAAEVGALPDSTKYGADLSLTSSTLQLLDQDGNALGSGVTVPDTSYVDTAISTLLSTLYPVGSLYIGTQSTCPLSNLISGSTWEIVATNRALWGGNGTNGNTTIAAGLPDPQGQIGNLIIRGTGLASKSGVFNNSSVSTSDKQLQSGGLNYDQLKLNFKASNSNSIYGNSSTVQPPAYRVNVWRRTA